MSIYVACKWKDDEYFKHIQQEYDIHNPVSDFHTTIIYSQTNSNEDLGFYLPGNIMAVGLPYKIETWKDKTDKNVLVMLLKYSNLEYIHKQIMSTDEKLNYDYPNYIPHITLSYDSPHIHDFNLPIDLIKVLYTRNFYSEPLKTY